MWRRILGFEARARGRLCLAMVLKGGKGRVGDCFRVSERLSVIHAVLMSAWFEVSITGLENYCSEDSIHSSRPGMGENVGAFGGS